MSKKKQTWLERPRACLPACLPVGVIQFDSVIFFSQLFLDSRVQSEAAPTSAPTWMDGALIGFSFLSLCHPRFTFFCLPFLSSDLSVFLATLFSPRPLPSFFFPLISGFFFFGTLFSPRPPPSFFIYLKYLYKFNISFYFIFMLLKLFLPTHLLPPTVSLQPTHLYI